MMMNARDTHNLAKLTGESRKAVSAAFDALRNWSEEVQSANKRCLTDVLDQVAAAQRATGWPDHLAQATRKNIEQAAELQTQMIDQLLEAWEELIESDRVPTTLPPGFNVMPSAAYGSMMQATDLAQIGELSIAPFRAWMKVADAWQRHWIETMSAGWQLPRENGGRRGDRTSQR